MQRPALEPFRLETPEAALVDLDQRLAAIRWPEPAPGERWRWGTDGAFLRDLVDHWRARFDWRRWERRLNAFPQFMATVSGIDIHVIVEPGSGDDPLPIVLTHGWPGSVLELIELIGPLAHPERHGGDVSDAFTVIVPSLPGFGFSPAPDRILSPQEVAGLWHDLMTEHLGFARYVAHGGDTGATVTSWMGLDRRESLPAIHLNTAVLQAEWTLAETPLDAEEAEFLARQQARLAGEDAYQHLHAEKPATLAFGLRDSPVALAAWIVEKMHGWTDPDDAALSALSHDAIIANIMVYWLGTLAPVHWLYQSLRDFSGYRLPPGRRIETPTGFCLFPKDIVLPPPTRWLERSYAVASVTRADTGGHFPGMERSDFLVEDIRAYFRTFRM